MAPAAHPAGPPVVLVAEDDVLVRAMLVDVLAEEGILALEARDAAEALDVLEARPDVAALVTDVEMPGALDGFALARRVRRRRPEIGVVVTSGRMAPGRDGLPAGARYLAKPMSNAALLAALREVMLPRSLRGDAEDGSPGDDPEAGRGAAHDPGSGILPASLLMDDPATLPHAPLSEIRPALDPEE